MRLPEHSEGLVELILSDPERSRRGVEGSKWMMKD